MKTEWTIEDLYHYDSEAAKIAKEWGIDVYPNQMEIITAEQMIDKYCHIGLPLGYYHWSYGKQYMEIEKQYKAGKQGLALELVINSNPCISYLMENNSLADQILIIQHAGYGHNSFFKTNYLFKYWTNASSIIDYMLFARNYILQCEEKYGEHVVEVVLNAAHSLMDYGIDYSKKPKKLSAAQEEQRLKDREEFRSQHYNEVYDTPDTTLYKVKWIDQENILYFLEKESPKLKPWQREILRIVRKTAQYFYPQRLTKVMNEGYASFVHYNMIYELYNREIIDETLLLSALRLHTAVIRQPEYKSLNPYTLGFNIFMDIKRICESPTDEDREYFPDIVDTDWKKTTRHVVANYKDETFILKYLSPKVCRDLGLVSLRDNAESPSIVITGTADDYDIIKKTLASQYKMENYTPILKVKRVMANTLCLTYHEYNARILDKEYKDVLEYIKVLWGGPVEISNYE